MSATQEQIEEHVRTLNALADASNRVAELEAQLAASEEARKRAEEQLAQIATECGKPNTVHAHSAWRVKLGEYRKRAEAAEEKLKALRREAWLFHDRYHADEKHCKCSFNALLAEPADQKGEE